MAFIGNTNQTQAFTPAVDYFSGNGSTTAFTLSRPVASVAQVEAVINNVVQDPASAYTVSGNTITFTSAPSSGTNNIYVRYTSPITQVLAPSQNTVYPSSLSVTNALYWDASANVGIGTTSPSGKVHVYQASGTQRSYFESGSAHSNVRLIAANTSYNTSVEFFSGASNIANINALGAGGLTFETNGSERARIDSSGNVGIGTSSPVMDGNGGLYVSAINSNGGTFNAGASQSGTANFVGSMQFVNTVLGTTDKRIATIAGITNGATNSGALVFNTWSSGSGAERARIDSSGNLLVGASSSFGAGKLQVQGSTQCFTINSGTYNWSQGTDGNTFNVYDGGGTRRGYLTLAGTWTNTSDRNYKENIEDLPYGLAEVLQLQARKYNVKGYEPKQIGFIAQEVEEILPELVDGEEGSKGLAYSNITAVLVKAIQEQQAIINDLKARIETLEAK